MNPNNSKKLKLLLYFFSLILLFPKVSYAYLDANTGSYVVQLFIAGVLGASLFLKDAVKKVKEIFKKNDKKPDDLL